MSRPKTKAPRDISCECGRTTTMSGYARHRFYCPAVKLALEKRAKRHAAERPDTQWFQESMP